MGKAGEGDEWTWEVHSGLTLVERAEDGHDY